MNERKFRFADSNEQVKKINKFLCVSTSLLNVISFVFVLISYLRGYRDELYTFGLLAIMIVTSLGGFIMYRKEQDSKKLRYVMMGHRRSAHPDQRISENSRGIRTHIDVERTDSVGR